MTAATQAPTLGNMPAGINTEWGKERFNELGRIAKVPGQAPVLAFTRTVQIRDAREIQRKGGKGAANTIHPVVVDFVCMNGPYAGIVVRNLEIIGAGMTGPLRSTAVGSINVGQFATDFNGGTEYPQLNPLDDDAMAYAEKVFAAAGGDPFAFYDAQNGTQTSGAAQPAPLAPVDRFADVPVTPAQQPVTTGAVATQPAPTSWSSQPVPGAGNPVGPTSQPAPAGAKLPF